MTSRKPKRGSGRAASRGDDAFRLLFMSHPTPMFVYDLETLAFLEVNDAAVHRYGYARDEFLAMTIKDIRPPEDVPRLLESVAHAPEGFEESGDWRHRLKDGRIIDVAITSHGLLFRGRSAKLVRAEDLTSRRRAEEALREKELLLIESQRMARLGSWVVELTSSRIAWSDEMYRIFGVSQGDFEPSTETLLGLMHRDDRARMQEWLRAFFAEEGPGELRFRIVRPDGRVRWLLGQGALQYDAARRPLRGFGTAQDVTESTQLQEQLRQAQKMESVGRLAGGVAHDFNNLLTVINSYTELALGAVGHDDPLREDLEQIRAAGARAAELTRQLLAFSRRQVLQPVVLNLNALVTATEKMLRRLIGEDIDLALGLARELGSVKADPGQIEQVIMNLVVNARDAMPGGGKLTIETGEVDLDEAYASQHAGARPGPYVMLAVSDTGSGMDEATRARVFEPFFTTKEVGRGTGLGLSTVYGIVKQSGGYIWAYSEVGVGTSFKVYLPRIAESARSPDAVPPQAPTRRSETVLVVEDERALRRAAVRILSSAGYTVLDAADGAEALRILEGHAGPLHLLLTDVIMPGMNGQEVAERLTASHPGLRVLFSSGYADDAVLRHGVLEPHVHFIAKPYAAQALIQKVREVLDESSAVSRQQGARSADS
jgi:two-component system cell cycle sensor histidine kinase/response regulator CckA